MQQGDCFNESQVLNNQSSNYGLILYSKNSSTLSLSKKNFDAITDDNSL